MTCMIVLGTPRSGTSAVAGLLHKMGVFMGQRLMAPMDLVNPLGFFEDEEFIERHIWMLRSDEEPSITFADSNRPDRRTLEDYAQLVARREAEHKLWGIKDPRLCFTLPYFLNRLRGDFRLIVTQRSFYESALSLSKLPGYVNFTLDRVVAVMGRYHFVMERSLREAKLKLKDQNHLLTIPYDALVRDPQTYTRRLADMAGLEMSETSLDKIAGEFIDPSLKHF
jgi:hypothetical protein